MNSVLDIPLDQVEVGERLRSVDPDHAALIAESFRANGQIQPIEVRTAGDRYALIAGAHRLEAARIAGMETIRAVVAEVGELEAELREIDENLCRRELSALDRAAFLAARQRVYLDLHPETGHGKRSGRASESKEDTLVLFPAFADATAEKLGVSARTVRRALTLHSRLMEDVRVRIAGTHIADSATMLMAISSLDAGVQRRVVEAMLRAEDPPRSVSAALLDVGATKAPKATELAEQQYQALQKAWGKAGRKARNRFVDFLADEGELGEARRAAS